MIYICKGCSGCCKACDDCCKEISKACQCIMDPICKAMDRPLGGYVLLNALVCLPAAVCAGVGLANEKVRDCDSPLMMFCAADVVLGLIHFCFSLYIQGQIVKGFEKEPLSSGAGQGEAPSAKELMNRAGHLVCYDIGFCMYFFVFVGSFGLNCVGLSWTTDCGGTAMPYVAASLLLMFAFMAVSFIYCWYCLLSCDECCSFFGQSPISAGRPEKKPGFIQKLILGNSRSQQVRAAPAGAAPAAAVGKPGPAPAPAAPAAAPSSGWSGGGKSAPAKKEEPGGARKLVGGGIAKMGKWIGGS
mmetsp:Transcript_94330/g.177510  ORF Transcript_94330/g.177510 Transcript_94330/m.177510 type:complete len:301 (+) Transcript_94330:101-1003(+)